MIAARNTMFGKGIPTVFKYIGIKFCANREIRSKASLTAYRSASQPNMQLSEIEFLTDSDVKYAWPSGMTISNYTMFDGEKHYSVPTAVSNYNSGESVGRLFDGSTSTKWCTSDTRGYNATHANIIDYDTGDILMQSGGSYDATFRQTHFGTSNNFTPVCLVLNVSVSPLDIKTYTKWRFYNANDNASQTGRTLIEGEVLGSVDLKTWWRLDVFNDTSIINTNLAVAHTANLVPRKGDLWYGMDLATRDWTNGIAVDNI